MKRYKIFIDRLNHNYLEKLKKGLSFTNIGSRVRPGNPIFIKPNLTYPHYKKGVMTSPEFIEYLIIALKDYSKNIIIGEADGGGYNRFSMDEVFEATGLRSIAKQHRVELVNLSKLPSRDISFDYKHKHFTIPLPRLLLDEVQLVITVPVPKVHTNTGISISIKNQWGCIQEPALRLKLHPYFAKVIKEINEALRVGIAVIDGRYGLNRNGPMRGDVEELGWLLIADDITGADVACCALMGIDPLSVKYLRSYNDHEPLPTLDMFEFNQDYTQFIGPKFYLKRDVWDYPGYFAFRSRFLAYLAYHSKLAHLLHKLLYLFREKFYDHG
ncbi:MAG TPA: DUF362 domain-containing protein [Syntrophorhabdales bacterium]|nr:DUF362 domain-containing protein [Syntrophorhabdales bacterium]